MMIVYSSCLLYFSGCILVKLHIEFSVFHAIDKMYSLFGQMGVPHFDSKCIHIAYHLV